MLRVTTDYESIRELALYCKKEGDKVSDLRTALRMKNYVTRLGTNVTEDQIEPYIANLVSSPDPASLIKVAGQVLGCYIMAQQSFNIFRLSTSSLMAWSKVRITCRMIGVEL
jgi:hypothetical protein